MTVDSDGLPGLSGLDLRVPNEARMYDYILGGKDNFAIDRQTVQAILAEAPYFRPAARENREFLGRAVRFIAEQGVRQFLDLGSGLPTRRNVHEIAQEVAPDARVVYVDHDAVAVSHGRALLASNGRVGCVQADLRDPDRLLGDPGVRSLIDFDRPVAILLFNVLHGVADEDDADDIIRRYRRAAVSGSYLAISLAHSEAPSKDLTAVKKILAPMGNPHVSRPLREIEGFFGDWRLEPPGIVECHLWRPDRPERPGFKRSISAHAGVARKP